MILGFGWGEEKGRKSVVESCWFGFCRRRLLAGGWGFARRRRRRDGAKDGDLPVQRVQDLSRKRDQVHQERFASVPVLEQQVQEVLSQQAEAVEANMDCIVPETA